MYFSIIQKKEKTKTILTQNRARNEKPIVGVNLKEINKILFKIN